MADHHYLSTCDKDYIVSLVTVVSQRGVGVEESTIIYFPTPGPFIGREPEQLSRWCILLWNGRLAQLSVFGESAGICEALRID